MGLLRRSVIVGVVGFAAVPTLADYFVTDIVDAARRGDYHAVHRIITDDPEAVQARDDHSYTSLHWAGIRSHWRIFSELVAAGADANAVGADGGTPLHWTSHHDRADMAALLLDAGADVNARNRWGRSPLHVAARRGCDAVAVLLLERGADLTAETAEGWTPLHTAMMADHLGVAAILIAAGADESATDDEGRTPAEVARHRPAATEIAPDTLDDYAGIYDLGGGFTSKVWREGDDLKIREFAPDGLYPIGTDAFHSVAEPWKVEFERAEDGMVDTIVLHFLRRSIKGSKSQSPRYVGSAACMSCHDDNERGSPAVSWMRSRHGHAYWRLGADWAFFWPVGARTIRTSTLPSPTTVACSAMSLGARTMTRFSRTATAPRKGSAVSHATVRVRSIWTPRSWPIVRLSSQTAACFPMRTPAAVATGEARTSTSTRCGPRWRMGLKSKESGVRRSGGQRVRRLKAGPWKPSRRGP